VLPVEADAEAPAAVSCAHEEQPVARRPAPAPRRPSGDVVTVNVLDSADAPDRPGIAHDPEEGIDCAQTPTV
jgi:hypothetical protein